MPARCCADSVWERMIPLAERWEAGVNEVNVAVDAAARVARLGACAEVTVARHRGWARAARTATRLEAFTGRMNAC